MSTDDLIASSTLSWNTNLTYSPDYVLSALATANVVSGEMCHGCSASLYKVKEDIFHEMVKDAEYSWITKTGSGANFSSYIIRKQEDLIKINQNRDSSVTIDVYSKSPVTAKTILNKLCKDLEDDEEHADQIFLGFWRGTTQGYRKSYEPIATPNWVDIKDNYALNARNALDSLINIEAPAADAGKLLLLNGPPGTGKTTLLRSLAREWSAWSNFDCVLDPERLFQDPNYILELALDSATDGFDEDDFPTELKLASSKAHRPWKLVILEDCDELISNEAKKVSGQSLSRLLNLTDGMLGQGKKLLIAITTNENISSLHPAVTRAGRCMAQIEIGSFPREEAVKWLGTDIGIPSKGATLAELYALKYGSAPLNSKKSEDNNSIGLYL